MAKRLYLIQSSHNLRLIAAVDERCHCGNFRGLWFSLPNIIFVIYADRQSSDALNLGEGLWMFVSIQCLNFQGSDNPSIIISIMGERPFCNAG